MNISITVNDTAYADYLYQLSDDIAFYYLIIAVPPSLLAKLIAIYIYTRPKLYKKTNTGFLYMWLSITNAFVILVFVFVVRSDQIFGYDIQVCGLNDFIKMNLYNMSSWIQVLISFDRYILVSYPAKVALMRKRKILWSVMLAMAIVIVCLNCPLLIQNQLVSTLNPTYSNNSMNISKEVITCEKSGVLIIVSNFFVTLMRVYLPFVIILTFNLLGIKNLKKAKINLNKYNMTQDHERHDETAKKKNSYKMSPIEYRFTVSNLANDFIFLTFFMPVNVYVTLETIDSIKPIFKTPIQIANFSLYTNLSQLTAFSYYMIDIVIFLALNRVFRDDLFALVKLDVIFRKICPQSTSTNTNDIHS